jgi:oligoendopeptidase F
MFELLPAAKYHFLPEGFQLEEVDDLKPFFSDLTKAVLDDVEKLKAWLLKRSELDGFLSENLAKRYIRMTCNTADEQASASYLYFVEKIQPEVSKWSNELDKLLVASPARKELSDGAYAIYFRTVENQVKLFREENVPLMAELQSLAQQYAAIMGDLSITWEGKEMTLQQAAKMLQNNNRELRRSIFSLIQERRLAEKEKLEDIFDKMLRLRHKVALNAGFENFRDFMFSYLGRFDYTVQDCRNFHASVRDFIVPITAELDQKRKTALQLDALEPFDLEVDTLGKEPLKPFQNGEELLAKTLNCFSALDPYFSNCIQTMNRFGLLDLDSRKGKAPGGYNYPLTESNMPFIFMNSVGTLRDLVTMVHEGGHAVHSFLTANLHLNEFKNFPSEVAELASMSMELMSMSHWDSYFSSPDELKRAKEEHLEDVLKTLPWVATIDSFQHWLYTNPQHTREERTAEWRKIYQSFSGGVVDWSNWEESMNYLWHKQLHIFEVPFYYIEYGFAQLGAIAVWRNFLSNKKEGIEAYKAGLSLGYTKSIAEIYRAAGISFDFSASNIQTLAGFVSERLKED